LDAALEHKMGVEMGITQTSGKLRKDADPAALATATMASIQGGLLLTQVRRDPNQLRIALNAARNNLRVAAA
jgi:TetR/AcrR family transcriptional repressor of nem operon